MYMCMYICISPLRMRDDTGPRVNLEASPAVCTAVSTQGSSMVHSTQQKEAAASASPIRFSSVPTRSAITSPMYIY